MDEAALIRNAQLGDVDAYNGLVLHYQTQVYNVAYRVMGERDAATDAAQEAFIRAYKNLGRFRGNFSISPNFGYELCIRKVSEAQKEGLDLRSWAVAVNA